MDDRRVIKSYVWHGDDCFFVSTIERDSSASLPPPLPRFNETLAWQYDYETMERGDIVATDGDFQGCLRTHFAVCEQLAKHGRVQLEEDK